MRLKVADVVEAVSQLVDRGYDREYRIKDGSVFDLAADSPLDRGDIHVDTALRLESGRNGGDASNIYAITDRKSHGKGLLIDAFDLFDQICARGLADRLAENRYTEVVDDSDTQRRALFRIGSSADLIEQNERRRFAHFDHPCDVGRV